MDSGDRQWGDKISIVQPYNPNSLLALDSIAYVILPFYFSMFSPFMFLMTRNLYPFQILVILHVA